MTRDRPTTADPPDGWIEWADALPAHRALGIATLVLDPDVARFRIDQTSFPLNGHGSVHGAFLAAVTVNSMTAQAVRAGAAGDMAHMEIAFHRRLACPFIVTTRLLSAQPSVLFVEAQVRSHDEFHRATASATIELATGRTRRAAFSGVG